MRLGELAARASVHPKTIRYHESIGLLPDLPRTATGCRIYTEQDIDLLAFVRRARQLELALDEIGEILALRERGERPCGYVLHAARAVRGRSPRAAGATVTPEGLHAYCITHHVSLG